MNNAHILQMNTTQVQIRCLPSKGAVATNVHRCLQMVVLFINEAKC